MASALKTAIAAHRFGLGEPALAALPDDVEGWLIGQIGSADAARGDGLLSTAAALELIAAEREKRRQACNPPPGMTAEQLLAGHYREAIVADARSRFVTAALTERPFAERLQLFWANHFTVSLAKGSVRGLVGAFERDAIRPRIAGRFEDLLIAATTHPAMLRYLDNTQSAGPRSRVVAREARRAERTDEGMRVSGLNENLAREILELHTLGAESSRAGLYAQRDVTEFARVLTGWRVGFAPPGAPTSGFDAAWHEPGSKVVLGKTYPEGAEALSDVLRDLALHPATARHVSMRLARHFVADDPPPALVDRMAAAWSNGGGRLDAVYRALIGSREAWQAAPAKLKTPEEFVISTVRVLRAADDSSRRVAPRSERMGGAVGRVSLRDPSAVGIALAGASAALGQRVHVAPSPAGWSDRAEDWLGPEAVWKRLEWAARMADRAGPNVDARRLAADSLGPLLTPETKTQLDRAADGRQALALLLLAPEFQRR